jgi:hypothetical protein
MVAVEIGFIPFDGVLHGRPGIAGLIYGPWLHLSAAGNVGIGTERLHAVEVFRRCASGPFNLKGFTGVYHGGHRFAQNPDAVVQSDRRCNASMASTASAL